MQDYIDDLYEDSSRIITKVNSEIKDLMVIASSIERNKVLLRLRELMAEKDFEDDDVAVQVLAWAYDKLGELNL